MIWAICLAAAVVAADSRPKGAVGLPTSSSNSAAAVAAGGRPAPAAKGNDLKHDLTVPFATAVLGGEAALSVQRQDGDVESIRVKIPAGIDDGKKIRLRGQGVPGSGDAPAGDILLTIHVSPHPFFRRVGNRLDVRVPITLAEAASGAKVDVPTPHGEGGKPGTITLTVPPNTSSGKRLRIKGHGVRPANQPAGDLFAEIQVELPDQLTDAEREQLAEISNRLPAAPTIGVAMVTGAALFGMSPGVLLAAEDAAEPVLERLDPPRRAAVVMALLALTLIGLFLIVFDHGRRTLGPAVRAASADDEGANRDGGVPE